MWLACEDGGERCGTVALDRAPTGHPPGDTRILLGTARILLGHHQEITRELLEYYLFLFVFHVMFLSLLSSMCMSSIFSTALNLLALKGIDRGSLEGNFRPEFRRIKTQMTPTS